MKIFKSNNDVPMNNLATWRVIRKIIYTVGLIDLLGWVGSAYALFINVGWGKPIGDLAPAWLKLHQNHPILGLFGLFCLFFSIIKFINKEKKYRDEYKKRSSMKQNLSKTTDE